jgi:hypothetical protein
MAAVKIHICIVHSFDHASFTKEFLSQIEDIPAATDPWQSSQLLRRLVKSEVLKFTDMRDAPEKFFLVRQQISYFSTLTNVLMSTQVPMRL